MREEFYKQYRFLRFNSVTTTFVNGFMAFCPDRGTEQNMFFLAYTCLQNREQARRWDWMNTRHKLQLRRQLRLRRDTKNV